MGHRSFQEIAGYQRLDELNEKIEEFSSRVLKKDCLDLPDKIFVRRNVALTDEQKKHYNEMKKLALTLFQDGMLSTTSSVLTQIMRLQQICCGFIKDDDETIRSINSNRITELIDILDETSGKVIIWASFVHDITAIRDALAKEFGEQSVVTYYGETPQEERQQIVKNFQEDETTRFFIGQPRTGGFGLTLHAASTVIYYSNSYDLEIRLQSEDRAHRIGQKNNVTYIDLVSPGTIDEKIINALRDKIDIAGQVLNETIESWIV
jgi:SNF2 family DNA or RNA helicase